MSISEATIKILMHTLQKHSVDDDCLELIHDYIKFDLDEKLVAYKAEKSSLLERMFKKQEYIENFLNNKDEKYFSVYNEILDEHVYIIYDGNSYEYVNHDDIYHKVIQELNPPSILSSMKRDVADEIIIRVEQKNVFDALPESITIQNLLSFFSPAFFETKEEFKYFLAVIGDCIFNKRQDIIYYIPELSREFLTVINIFYKDYFGEEINLTRFKFKYRGHDYEHSRIIQIKKTISSMSFLSEYIKKNIFNLLVVACHYSNRYQNAETYINKQNTKLQDKILYLTVRNKAKIVNEFLKTNTRTLTESTISQNDMYFLWKLFCDSKDLPLIMYKSNFISCLNDELTNEDNIYRDVTSERLNPAKNLKKFWEKSIKMYDTADLKDEYEISELCELYNIWLKEEENTEVVINEKDMKELILYFYPKIELKDKSIKNIYCSYWNKQEDMREAIKSKFDKEITENMSLVQAYLSYVSYSDKHEKINCCSKKYFEKYIKNIIPEEYLKNKSIFKEYWETI
jgi:hypothetical protein